MGPEWGGNLEGFELSGIEFALDEWAAFTALPLVRPAKKQQGTRLSLSLMPARVTSGWILQPPAERSRQVAIAPESSLR
jgi:hypothetical protein